MDPSPRRLVRKGLLILLGAAVYALAFNWCYVPNGIAFGGLTGVAQLVNHLLPGLPVGTLVMVMNVPLFLLGWRLLGGGVLGSSLWAMGASSLLIDAIAARYTFSPMEPMLAAIFGGLLLGAGLGLVFLQGATTGGTDLMARLLKLRLTWLPMGRLLLMIDLTVIVVVAAAFGRLESGLYGLVALYISTLVMDALLYGLDTAKAAYIVSDAPEEIARSIMDGLERSVTFLRGRGGYTGAEKQVILCAFKQREIVGIKEAVRRADPGAFMIVTNAYEVLGEGFKGYHGEGL